MVFAKEFNKNTSLYKNLIPTSHLTMKLQKKLKILLEKKYTIPLILAIITLSIYTHHLSPGVYGTDSGDFVTAALTKGVPHPSGYPLITLLGILFLKLPISATPAWKMGLISVFASSASVVIFYLIGLKITNNKAVSFISSLMLAFTYPFWLYAEVVEVFALHNFLILLAVYISINLYTTKKIKHLYLLCFILGLSLTNNLSVLLIFPAIAVLILINKELLKLILNTKAIMWCILLFIFGLLPYLYIPIAARGDPYINWGMAVNLENFIYLVLRKKYGWGISSGTGDYSILIPYESLKAYFNYYKIYLSPLIPVFSVLGMIFLFKKNFKLLLFILVLFIFFGPFSVIYSWRTDQNFTMIGVLERFYLSSIVIIMIFIAPGFEGVLKIISRLLKNPKIKTLVHYLTLTTLTIIPVTFFIVNYQKTDLSKNYYYDNLGHEILEPLPKNSFLFFVSDTYSFPVAYSKSAFGFRTDIKTPGENTGYRVFLENTDIVKKEDIEKFLMENKNSLKKEILTKGIAQLIDREVPVFSEKNITFEDETYGKIVPVPYGLVFHLVKEKDRPDKDTFYKDYLSSFSHINPEFLLEDRLFDENAVLADLKILYSQYYRYLGNYFIDHYGDSEMGLNYIGKSFEYSMFLNIP
jgi:hypothetical protein